MRRRHVLLLPRLASRQQHQLGERQQAGETSRDGEVPIVNRVERAAENADASSAGKVRFQWAILFMGIVLKASRAAPGSRNKAALPGCPVRASSRNATSRRAAS